jgi:hypothetical protein
MAARTFASVKLKADLVDDARKEAELFNRSVAGQIEHWVRLGKALEGASGVSIDRVRETLQGRLKLEDLSLEEHDAVMDIWLGNPSDQEVAAYAALAELPGAVGTDEKGRLIVNPIKPRLKAVR